MYRKYSEAEMVEILKGDVKIPDKIEEKIQDAYRQIGAENIRPMRKRKTTTKMWKAIAAVAALTVGTSAVVVAANYMLSSKRVENGKNLVYEISVDREIEAHAVKVEPTYMPEGYVYHEEGPYGGKWHNEETDGGITIITYNAAELDRLARIGQDIGFHNYKKDTELKEVDLGGQKLDVYTGEDSYIDSDDTVKQLYLFNEEYGYGIHISSRSTLDTEELVKVAEGLEVNVLDEVVPYATEAEIEEEIARNESISKQIEEYHGRSIAKDSVYSIGEEVVSPAYDRENDLAFVEKTGVEAYISDDIRFTVKGAEFRDFISLEEFAKENFETYEELEPWLNKDGTLKSHERMLESKGDQIETVDAKFLVVKMNAANVGETQNEWNLKDGISIAPDLTTLTPCEDGTYRPQTEYYRSANEDYNLQYYSSGGSSFPIYFDQQHYTEGIEGMKRAFFRPIAPGESLDYTLIYVVDADQTENTCLRFSSGAVGGDEVYIAIGENVAK